MEEDENNNKDENNEEDENHDEVIEKKIKRLKFKLKYFI